MKTTYLILAVVGAIVPYFFFLQHFQAEGFGLPAFIAGIFANPAASGFTVDLLVSSFIFWLFMFQDRRLTSAPRPALFIALNLLIGLSCAFPAYLYARESARSAS